MEAEYNEREVHPEQMPPKEMTPEEKSIEALGGHPLKANLKMSAKIFFLASVVTGALYWFDDSKIFFILGGTLIFGFWALVSFFGILSAPLEMSRYNKIKKLIKEGKLEVSYTGAGSIVVDKKNRQIYWGGTLYSFDDVKKVNWHSFTKRKHRLELHLSKGDKPVLWCHAFTSEGEIRTFAVRLCNDLGFS
ncbi:hypothetical protein [Geoalkalibacter subterraneus]|uniref:Uncharacterized protein n=1 Tax=Geoalkalibacter subterraneus TaxID=483547 RepID=A0A0B5FVR4_9BACT|nr:hypothetical protein [Geoalkalibacter subterraneus]AJF08245.1 hypothetical protein GSUB_17320 [Geoalkalibacter subterraneus]